MSEVKKEIDLEIAHVLFVDIVGYSKLLINDQRRLLEVLNQLVRGTEQFRVAEQNGRLISIPTGDGMALVFYQLPEAPVECALELARAGQTHPELRLRMGVHSGPVSGVIDVNGRANIAGAGINMAQRVMDCGDAGHILLSKRVAEDLEQYGHWRPHLHDLGETEVKHGVRVRIVNLYTDELGNPAPPEKFKTATAALPAAPMEQAKRGIPWHEIVLAVLLLGAIVAAGVYFLRKPGASAPDRVAKTSIVTPAATNFVPEKSIAVLPFENLSKEEENAFFTNGVQDEILTTLAKVADLKVISRTSVMQFRDPEKRNLREIAQALNVAHVLEGSVQRSANRVRVTAQLIDARTDTHLWAERYDRDLADVFAIQTEIAQKIAQELRAALSPDERAALQARPTTDTAAYDFYLQAREIYRSEGAGGEGLRVATPRVVKLLDEAVARDPRFVPALCMLAQAHLRVYWFNLDHTPARLELARNALEAAARLQPDAGQVHFARALFHYWGNRDYDPALAELELARRSLPNEADIPHFMGAILRRQGRWEESIPKMEQAQQIDPRSAFLARDLSWTYLALRRYDDARRILENVLAWRPNDLAFQVGRAEIDFSQSADLRRLQKVVADPPAATDPDLLAAARAQVALLGRDYAALAQALAEYRRPDFATDGGYVTPREYFEGIAALGRADLAGAEAAFLRARERAAAHLAAGPDDAKALMVLAEVDAKLGRKDEARRQGERAVEMLPIAQDAFHGPGLLARLAGVYAQIGDTERAVTAVEQIVGRPGGPHYGVLRLEESIEPLRAHPRFEEIVADLAPKPTKR